MFFSLTRLNLLHPNLGRAGLKRPAAMLSSPSRLNYEPLFVVSLKMITWCVFVRVFDESKVELIAAQMVFYGVLELLILPRN